MADWVARVQSEFPALVATQDWVLCDAPTGTQVHSSVTAAISRQLNSASANLGGSYPGALNTIQGVARAREAAAAFLNCEPREIVFGPNMTSITQQVARAVGRTLGPGSSLVVTNLDHDANVTPWVQAAEDKGATIRRVDFHHSDCLLDLEALERAVCPTTALVALGAAANSCGSLTDIRQAVKIVREASAGNALVYVDAVHLAPHRLIDVQALGCDFLTCSAYKFWGPHAGLMFGRAAVLAKLQPYKLAACTELLPGLRSCQASRWETGTASFEALAGIRAAIEYLGRVGELAGEAAPQHSLREKLAGAFRAIGAHEDAISRLFLNEAAAIPGLTVHGVTCTDQIHSRTPTFALTMQGLASEEFARQLVGRGVVCGAGHFYALYFPKLLGLADNFTRIGFCHYHTLDQVKTVLDCIRSVALAREVQ